MAFHPFADLIGLKILYAGDNESTCALSTKEDLYNPHEIIHGAVLYAMADTGMGSAIYPTLDEGEICATIEVKINYFKPVFDGDIECHSKIVNRGKTIANVDSEIFSGDRLVAKANGTFAIYKRP